MGFDSLKFGTGPKELGGSVDLISHYKLWPHHEFFCKKSLPLSISETNYLHNVVGDREIRKGDGMELDQLFQDVTLPRKQNRCIHPFGLDVLTDVFHMQEATAAKLSSPDRGTPTAVLMLGNKAKERRHKKDRKGEKHKSKQLELHKHQSKRNIDDEARGKNTIRFQNNGPDPLKNREKKRQRDGSQHDSSQYASRASTGMK
ncbi:unnamed protein product [Amaranthus hypochondriacus]